MAVKKTAIKKANLKWEVEEPNPKQLEFLQSEALFTCYGGARGGGKSWVLQRKAIGSCLYYAGLKCIIIRAHYPELEQNHILPIKSIIAKMGGDSVATYNGTNRMLTFYNGSTIKFGHWDGENSEDEYQGTEYDFIFIDEATQFSERAFNYLGSILRGTNDFPKRFYLTCNPGGIGHRWVKRLFIDREYKTHCANPEENENPNDYKFIFATVEDNKVLLEKSPTYLRTLANMPEDLRRAHRYGDWDAIGGAYFKEFTLGKHTCKKFPIPRHWKKYRAFDYGLDQFSIGWFAVDEDGRCWLYRSFEESNLIISEAAKAALTRTLPNENIEVTYAPPDMWGRSQETGKSRAELFFENGLSIVKASNNRVQGHMIMKEMLANKPLRDPTLIQMYKDAGKEPPKTLPALVIFETEEKVINDIRDIQADEKNPDDCSKEPHEVTHNVDMVRYFCISRVMAAEKQEEANKLNGKFIIDDPDEKIEYNDFLLGGELNEGYLSY